MQEWHQIPDGLIINFDQTPLSYVCSLNHTLHFEGGKSLPLVGKGKSKQTTGTFSCTKSGIFLPMQLIYHGKTKLPIYQFTPQVLNSLKDSTILIQRTTGVFMINLSSIFNQLFFHLPSQREPSWIWKKSKNACSFFIFLRFNAPNMFLIWSMKTIVLLCSY